MKKFLVYLTCLALVLSLTLAIPAFSSQPREVVHAAETTTSASRVVVNGFGEATVVPDIAKVTVAVNTANEDITTAETNNTNAVDSVINALINAGVTENNVKTISYTIYERTETEGDNQTTIYNVSSVLEFKTSATEDLSGLINTLTEAGVTQVYGVNFEVSDTTSFYSQALTAAINDASKKATTIFGNSNFKIIEIIEAPLGECEAMPLMLARSNVFKRGEKTVSAFVKVVFEAA